MSSTTYELILTWLSVLINKSANCMPRLWVSSRSHVINWTTHEKKRTPLLWVTKPSRAPTPHISLNNLPHTDHTNWLCHQSAPRPLVVLLEERNLSFSTRTNLLIQIVSRSSSLLMVCHVMCAAKVGAEEVIGIRYALRFLGVKLTRPTKMIGDNQGQLDSVSNAGAFCKKKAFTNCFSLC
jgi:hypothetical protein